MSQVGWFAIVLLAWLSSWGQEMGTGHVNITTKLRQE